MNKFVIRLLQGQNSCACLLEMKTEFELEEIIFMQLKSKI